MMSHANITIAQRMRQVLLYNGHTTITRADVALLDWCALISTHTTLMSVPRRERHRRIFNALEVSALFLKRKWRVGAGWRVEYRLLEAEPSTRYYVCPYCASAIPDDCRTRDGESLRCLDCESVVEFVDAEEIA